MICLKFTCAWSGADDVMFFPYGAARMFAPLESSLPYLMTGAEHVSRFICSVLNPLSEYRDELTAWVAS